MFVKRAVEMAYGTGYQYDVEHRKNVVTVYPAYERANRPRQFAEISWPSIGAVGVGMAVGVAEALLDAVETANKMNAALFETS